MKSKKEFAKVLTVNGAIYVLLPMDFCRNHRIERGDFLQREIEQDGIKFIPLEAWNMNEQKSHAELMKELNRILNVIFQEPQKQEMKTWPLLEGLAPQEKERSK